MKKGLMILNNKVEDVESLATKALLTRAGYNITTATLENNLTITTQYNLEVKVDYYLKDIDPTNFDFLIIPGGGHVFNWLNNDLIKNIITKFNNDNKLIAAICAAPLFLNELGLLKSLKFTAFPDVSNDIDGIYQKDLKVVQTANFITSRSAGTVYDFVFEIIKYLDGTAKLQQLKNDIVY